MKLFMIRHGEPNYVDDCLTETGRKQAAAAAERLALESLDEIYASSNGRAKETASYTANAQGLPIKELDYMREITWGGEGVPVDGHPWTLSDWMINEEDFDFAHDDWREHPYFKTNKATENYDYVTGQFDAFMKEHGYIHEGSRFLCTTDEHKNVAIFGHGGSGACVLSSLLNLAFPYTLVMLPYGYTSIIVLDFPVKKGSYVHPRIELFNDMLHVRNLSDELKFQQKSE